MASPVRAGSSSVRAGDPFPDPPSPRDDPRSGSPFPPDRPVPAPVARPPGSSESGPDPASRSGRGKPASSNPDAPVRYEVAMPRGLFDRLTGHDHAPRCRYDMATGRAEFVAEPGPGHEWRAAEIPILIRQVENSLSDAGHAPGFFIGGATRLLSDDGAFEPDASLFIDPPDEPDLREHDGYLDVRKGHSVPDLVVEIDRSVASSHKLAPYFRMGVREAWTFGRRDGVRIWVPDPALPSGLRSTKESRVLPGLDRSDLDGLLAGDRAGRETASRSRQLAKRVARTILARQGRG